MAKDVKFTVSQLFKSKGGYVRHSCEGDVVRVEMKIGNTEFVGRTGADLKGFRMLEERFDQLLNEELFGVEQTSKSTMGVDQSYIRRNLGTTNLGEAVPKLLELISKQKDNYDVNGWIVDKIKKVGTPGDYVNGVDLDVILCPNEASKKRMSKFLDSDEGEWKGLEFHLNNEEPAIVVDFESILYAWERESYKDCESDLTDWNEIVESEEPMKAETTTDQDNADKIMKDHGTNFNILETAARLKLFWGGGKPPSSRRAAESIAAKCFPDEEVEYPAATFTRIVKERLVSNWGFELQKAEMGEVDLDQLVIGQILQKKGQILVNYGKKTLTYVPKPAAYKASQMRGK